MTYFRKILQFAKPYKQFAILNIVCNIFYALFSTLSFIALIPVINILFDKSKRVAVKPDYEGLATAKDFVVDYFNYQITQKVIEDEVSALIFICGVVVLLFFLKNLFGYLAAFFITFLRNGVLRDVRNALYNKILHLPIAYFSEKKKGDTISRITADVNEVQTSFLS
ncbi:MAG TPA: ABC transporter transmembrane domain-containing protein, partial [Gillisia sp.]|nr:ABC transporter transmembrane domain-containing protein [Gillisia sp.]